MRLETLRSIAAPVGTALLALTLASQGFAQTKPAAATKPAGAGDAHAGHDHAGHAGHDHAGAMDPAMEAMMKAMTPGAEHKKLAQAAGDWSFTLKSWMEPGKEPMQTTGTSKMSMILDGRYLQEHVKSEMMGQPFHGIGTTGYDNAAKKYVSTWLDSMSTGMMVMSGNYDTAGKVLTMTGEHADPMTGKPKKVKLVQTDESPKKFVVEMFEARDAGKEMKVMELVYTRP